MFSMKRGLVSPDVLFTFGFTFRKSTDNTAKYNLRPLFLTFLKSYIFIKSYMILPTFNALFKLSYKLIVFDCSVSFSPTFHLFYRKVRRMS